MKVDPGLDRIGYNRPSDMEGQRLSHFRILAKLGEGGMGVVYRAEDERLRRTVALKLLPPELAGDEERRARFLREAQAAAAVNHSAIASIHEVGEEQGVVFIAMELVEGRTLRAILGDGPLGVGEALRIATAITEALEAAHARGVAHRDLKPENVMVLPDGRVKVLDFGLAKRLEPEASGGGAASGSDVATRSARLTREGLLVGTAAYMSPEQARGEAVDARTDLFALGVVLYEMLAGSNPFQRATLVETLAALLKDAPAPVSEANAAVPLELAAVVERLLEKPRGRRPASAGIALAQLRAAAGALAEASSAPRSIAVLPFANLSGDAEQEYFSDGMAEELINALARVPGLRVAARMSAFQFKGRAGDVREVGEKLGVETVLEGSVRRSGPRLRVTAQLVGARDGYHLWSERYDRDLADVFAIQDEITERIVEALKARLGVGEQPGPARGTRDLEAYGLYLKGRHVRISARGLPRAIECFAEATRRDPSYGAAHAGLADALLITDFWGHRPFPDLRERVLAAVERALALDPHNAEAHFAQAGTACSWLWDWPGAERSFRRALELDPRYTPSRLWYGWLLCSLGRGDEALALARRGVELDPLSPYAHFAIGSLLRLVRRHHDARRALEEALRLEPGFAAAAVILALVPVEQSKAEEAIELALRAVEQTARAPLALGSLGWAYAAAGRPREARTLLEELEAREGEGSVNPYWAPLILAGLGEREAFFARVERLLAERRLHPYIVIDPAMDSLRGNPRFGELLRRLGLPAAHQEPAPGRSVEGASGSRPE